MGQKLNVDFFDNMSIKDTKNWFEFKDGGLEVKDFDYKWKDIAMTIGGSHKINQDMNYHILAKIPRKMLEKSSVGAAANSGLDALSKEAGKLGIDIAQSEFVNVRFTITGTIAKPQVGMKLVGTDGKQSLADAAKDTAQKEFDKQKDKVVDEAKQKVEEVKQQAKDTVQAVIKENTEKAKQKAQGGDRQADKEDPGSDQEGVGGV
ncbi:MAG: hypothetical protein IPH04_15795 [Saprospirales bacterium]|nr:hypothetical protein [Saprospirales bacterium]